MDLTTGSFYKAFGSKNKIFHMVLKKTINDFDDGIERIIVSKKNKINKLKELVLFLFTKEGLYGNELFKTTYFLSKEDAIVKEYLDKIFEMLMKLCLDISSNSNLQSVEVGQNADFLCKYLIGLYFSDSMPLSISNLDKKSDFLTKTFIKDE
ncbi:hypothetical protein BSQ40_23625 [Serratia fonticola]|nr:hypothetical protein BSQ40_23625 [Serratia fonticola]